MPSLNRRTFAATMITTAMNLQAASLKINMALRTGIGSRKIPAAVGMVASGNNILYQGAFGIRDASGVPVKTDSIFAIHSMTKAITTAAALQMVEQGKVQLDEPVAKYLPKLAKLEVLRGFDNAGKPILSAAKTQVTLKHLLTHTSGFCYDNWDGEMFRYTAGQPTSEVPPLMFEAGTRWQYGQGIDWAGRLVETLSGMSLEDYFQVKILKPLGMIDTSYIVPAAKFDRLVTGYHRQENGPLLANERKLPSPPTSFGGGGGLYSTAADYVRFMQMILNLGQGILKPQTVESMRTNQIGRLTAGKMKSYKPSISSDVDIQPGQTEKWGLGFLINTTPYSGGRAAGSLAWAGLENTFYWIDPKNALCAILLMRFLPFVDKQALGLLDDFEKAVYAG